MAMRQERAIKMAINRDEWLKAFRKDWFPEWHCPKCGVGTLEVLASNGKTESPQILVAQTKESTESEYEDEAVFAAILRCNRNECRELISVCGTSEGVEVGEYGQFSWAHRPIFFSSAPAMFRIPKSCP